MSKADIDYSVRVLFAKVSQKNFGFSSIDGPLHQAVDAFQQAHALYWISCDEGRVRLFNFLDFANPLVENFCLHRSYTDLQAA